VLGARWGVGADPTRTTIGFATRGVFGPAPVRGTFRLGHGSVRITDSGVEGDAVVRATSIDTGNGARDDHVRSRDYLAVDGHPDLGFHGTFTGEATPGARIEGELTVCGTTRPTALVCESVTVDHTGLTARATTTIDRYEFGVTHGKGITGRHLALTLLLRPGARDRPRPSSADPAPGQSRSPGIGRSRPSPRGRATCGPVRRAGSPARSPSR
jgi:polyisoprenoid-binding protein YceI